MTLIILIIVLILIFGGGDMPIEAMRAVAVDSAWYSLSCSFFI